MQVADSTGLRQRGDGHESAIEHVDVDRDVQLLRGPNQSVHDGGWSFLEQRAGRGEGNAEPLHILVLVAVDGPQAEGGDVADGRQLVQPPELAAVLEFRAIDRVGEIRMSVEVNDVDHPVGFGHPSPDREADRVIPTDRDDHRPALSDFPDGGRRARLAELDVATGDQHVAAIGQPDALEVVTLGFDIEPAGAGAIRPRFPEARPRLPDETRSSKRTRPNERDDHALIGWNADKADAGVQLVEVVKGRSPEEGPGGGPGQRPAGPLGITWNCLSLPMSEPYTDPAAWPTAARPSVAASS